MGASRVYGVRRDIAGQEDAEALLACDHDDGYELALEHVALAHFSGLAHSIAHNKLVNVQLSDPEHFRDSVAQCLRFVVTMYDVLCDKQQRIPLHLRCAHGVQSKLNPLDAAVIALRSLSQTALDSMLVNALDLVNNIDPQYGDVQVMAAKLQTAMTCAAHRERFLALPVFQERAYYYPLR